jgi:hypothetical protein
MEGFQRHHQNLSSRTTRRAIRRLIIPTGWGWLVLNNEIRNNAGVELKFRANPGAVQQHHHNARWLHRQRRRHQIEFSTTNRLQQPPMPSTATTDAAAASCGDPGAEVSYNYSHDNHGPVLGRHERQNITYRSIASRATTGRASSS